MSTFNCAEFQRELNQLVESHGCGDVTSLNQHAASCTACRVLWEQHCLLDQAIAEWQEQPLEVDILESVLAHLAFEHQHSNSESKTGIAENRRIPRPSVKNQLPERIETSPIIQTTPAANSLFPHQRAPALRSILVLALLATVGLLLHSQPARNPIATTDHSIAIGDNSSTEWEHDDEELEAVMRNAGNAYLVLAHDTAEAVASVSRLVSQTDRFTNNESRNDSTSEKQPDWVDRWGHELAPIRKDFSEALDFLFESPSSEAPPTI